MTFQVTLTLEARADVAGTAAWHRDRSVHAAEKISSALSAALMRIQEQPTAQVVVDFATGARRALLRRFPHRVLYLVESDRVIVFAVVHHLRDDPAWRERLC